MSGGPRVVVAHEEQPVRDAAVRVAREAGYEVVGVGDGGSALALLQSAPPPAVLVADVGLTGVAAYELCDEISSRSLATKVILIASVYSKTAYKRRPTSLYGADDYVEQHHVVDKLGPKLAALVPAPRPVPEVSVHDVDALSPEQRRDAERMRALADYRLADLDVVSQPSSEADWLVRGAELARIVVADLVLYNGTEVEQWLDAGSTPETLAERPLPPRLLSDLEEARRLVTSKLPPDVAARRDFAGEALLEFFSRRGKGV